MPDTVNPYIPGQPVDTPELFFGRRDILTSVREHLLKGRRVFVVSSPPRMGKSSLLRQLPTYLPEEFVSSRLDLAEEDAEHLDSLLWRVACVVWEQVREQPGGDNLKPQWADFEGQTGFLLDRFWPGVRTVLGTRSFVMMMDDLEILAQANADLHKSLLDILEMWRAEDGDVGLVLAVSPVGQEALMRSHPRLSGGAMSYTLGPLSSEAAGRLITWPVDGVLTYDYGVARRMIEITSGQPYFLQLLCFEVFNRCAVSGWVNQHDLDIVVEELVGREITDFRELWDESSSQEQAVLAALVSLRGARGVATVREVRMVLDRAGPRTDQEQVTRALDSLADRAILERLGALSYRFRVGLLRDWLGQRLDLREVVRGTRWDAEHAPKAGESERVLQLTTRRARDRRRSTRSERASGGAAEDDDRETRSTRSRWLWVAPVALFGVVVLALAGVRLLAPAVITPTPGGARASTTMQVALQTRTVAPNSTVRPVAGSTGESTAEPSPTETTKTLPTATATPTPPLVVARPVAAIAYQSRGAGESQWSLSLMSSDGSNRTVLTEGQAGFLSPPSWSPDGSRIAFVSDRGGNPDIWVIDTDGENLVNLTQHEEKDHSPAWSPDGAWIAFASVRDSLYWELYLMRPDGTDVLRLTWWEDASDLSPSWSPDSTRLAFASKRDGNWEIYIMDRDGGNLTRLTNDDSDDTNPAWSPDGSRIAFESTREGYAEIYVMAVGGGEAVNISNAPFSSEHGPTWSPDGGRIAFYSDRDGEWDIYVMGADGSDPVKLTGDNTNDQVPAWRP
jgi:hypothetical protein